MNGWTDDAGISYEFERVMRGNVVCDPVHRPSTAGGEWDHLLGLSPHTLRRLRGARYLTPYGLHPDQAEQIICDAVPRIGSTDQAMAWYVRHALLTIDERRRRRHRERHLALAKRHGYRTYFRYREFLSILRGYESYSHERRMKGWAALPTAEWRSTVVTPTTRKRAGSPTRSPDDDFPTPRTGGNVNTSRREP